MPAFRYRKVSYRKKRNDWRKSLYSSVNHCWSGGFKEIHRSEVCKETKGWSKFDLRGNRRLFFWHFHDSITNNNSPPLPYLFQIDVRFELRTVYYSISLLHSLISSVLFVLALAKTPQVFEDFHGKNQLIELACCFTIGFYIFDIYNIVCNNPNNYLQWVLNCPIFLVFFLF